MPDSTNTNRGWFRYTADDGSFFAVKTDKGWGASGDSGLIAYGGGGPAYGADPIFPRNGRNHPRYITGEEAVTFRTTRRIVGALDATAWTDGGYTIVSGWKGIAGAANYVKQGRTEEHLGQAHAINSRPEAVGV